MAHLFTGHALRCSDIRGRDLQGTRWLYSGRVLSHPAVPCRGIVPIKLTGTRANGEENLARLIDNVKSLFQEVTAMHPVTRHERQPSKRVAAAARFGMMAGAFAAVMLIPPVSASAQPNPASRDSSAPVAPASQPIANNQLQQQNLAIRHTGGFVQYRIPALAVTNKGTLIAAYDGRPSMADLPSHIAILIRRSSNGGKTWGPQQVVREAPPPAGFGDSSLLIDRRSGRIFLFYAASINKGYVGSHTGNDPHNTNILQANYSYSDDDGLSWHARSITRQIKNPAWGGLFAASGEGIQLQQGRYAGRLIQQYVIRIDSGNFAASLYSDDYGKTWKMGQPVGPGMDENKSVGLVNGDVLLDVRARPKRLFAISHNGGESWSTPEPVPALTDPGDNGSIIRYAPIAPASQPESHWLLESNTDDPAIRRNLVVRMSCDDGKTWPIARVVDPGSAGYSTLTMQPHGRIGLFYERDGYQKLTYTSFTLSWLNGLCTPLRIATPAIVAGSRGTLQVTVTNQTDHRLRSGKLTLKAPSGWVSAPVPVQPITTGGQRTVNLPYMASTTHVGTMPLTVYYTVDGKQSLREINATVSSGSTTAPMTASLPIGTAGSRSHGGLTAPTHR